MLDGDPPLPLTPDLKKLDSVTFRSQLQGYDPKFIDLIDRFCKASLCESVDRLSALAGYWLAQDLVDPRYVFPGGNSAIVKAMNTKVDGTGKGRYLKDTFVWNVSIKSDGAVVTY